MGVAFVTAAHVVRFVIVMLFTSPVSLLAAAARAVPGEAVIAISSGGIIRESDSA